MFVAITSLLSILLAVVITAYGLIRLAHHQDITKFLRYGMLVLFLVQTICLVARGIESGSCPLLDRADIYYFLGWSLNFFFLLLGRSYRMSVLGGLTAPAVLICCLVSWFAGLNATSASGTPLFLQATSSSWLIWHVALVLMGYGALGLSALSGIVFLVQSRMMKRGLLTGLCRSLPPIRTLQSSAIRLIDIGLIFVIAAQVCAFSIGEEIPVAKWVLAMLSSAGYLLVVLVAYTRGIPGRMLAWATVLLYCLSLLVFSALK